jgi:hypothetical protein
VLLPIIACTLLAACASGGNGYHAEEARERPSGLVVENHMWAPVTVYILRSGQPSRLGNIDGLGQRSFSLDKLRFAVDGSDVYLVARPLAGQPFRSEPFTFFRGGTAIWTIENSSQLSHVVLR